MDEKVLEEIRFHQDVVNKDASSPLYQIREKEMEISGRVLAAKGRAEKTVSDARRKATEIMKNAEVQGDKEVKEYTQKTLAEADKKAERLRAGVVDEAKDLEARLSARREEAADYIVKIVTTV
ncbi:MAG: V-type ATPase subunit subunit G family protein [Coriobacteriia bacterium]|nr:V-type ATPase subunit subunit G family protein [Coriobacteriia bacterium]